MSNFDKLILFRCGLPTNLSQEDTQLIYEQLFGVERIAPNSSSKAKIGYFFSRVWVLITGHSLPHAKYGSLTLEQYDKVIGILKSDRKIQEKYQLGINHISLRLCDSYLRKNKKIETVINVSQKYFPEIFFNNLDKLMDDEKNYHQVITLIRDNQKLFEENPGRLKKLSDRFSLPVPSIFFEKPNALLCAILKHTSKPLVAFEQVMLAFRNGQININDVNNRAYQWSPFMIAVVFGNKELVEKMIELGGDPSITTVEKQNSLDLALTYKRDDLIDILIGTNKIKPEDIYENLKKNASQFSLDIWKKIINIIPQELFTPKDKQEILVKLSDPNHAEQLKFLLESWHDQDLLEKCKKELKGSVEGEVGYAANKLQNELQVRAFELNAQQKHKNYQLFIAYALPYYENTNLAKETMFEDLLNWAVNYGNVTVFTALISKSEFKERIQKSNFQQKIAKMIDDESLSANYTEDLKSMLKILNS